VPAIEGTFINRLDKLAMIKGESNL